MNENPEIKRTTVDLPVKYIEELKEKGIPINKAAYYGIKLILDKDKQINKILSKIENHELQIQNLNREIEFIMTSPDINISEVNPKKDKNSTLNMLRACNFTWKNVKESNFRVRS